MPRKMIKTFIQDRLIQLDIEFGNAAGFFSGSKQGICIGKDYENSLVRKFTADITDAKLEIEEKCFSSECKIIRSIKFTAISESQLYDMVSRYVVLSNDRPAYIAGKKITHACSNIYHQFPVKEAKVPLGDAHWLKFSDDGSSEHPAFDSVFYVRDESIENGMKRWIVHHRKIVKPDIARLIVRSCNPRFEGALPAQRLIPQFIKRELFRIRESRYPSFPLMAVGEVSLSNGCVTEINTLMQIAHD